MRKRVIAANWKMHKRVADALAWCEEVGEALNADDRREAVVFPSFTTLGTVAKALASSSVGVGGQNMHWAAEGAYTGEVSGDQLLDLGCTWVLLGHSERRQYFGETDEALSRKIRAALNLGLRPMLCVGEVLHEREGGETMRRLTVQVTGALEGLSLEEASRLTLAYEPIWAIGTGRAASAADAQETTLGIRSLLGEMFGTVADGIPILYGGSVSVENVGEFLAASDIDGVLVGGASLDSRKFRLLWEAAGR